MNNVLLFLFLTTNFILGQEPTYHHPSKNLTTGQYALFGDDVKFRKAPDVNSKVLGLLKIGGEIEVLEKTDKTLLFNGIDSPFYKVRYNGKDGYVLGGLISLEKKESKNITYLFQYKKNEYHYDLLVRSLNKNQLFSEASSSIEQPEFSIAVLDNKGLTGVEQILQIENHPEACGVSGGDIYFFKTDNGLKKAFKTSIYSDAGVNWFNENLVFPNDEGGVADRIVYRREQGEYGDEATNEIHVATTSRELRWENGELLPKIDIEDQ